MLLVFSDDLEKRIAKLEKKISVQPVMLKVVKL